MPKTIWKNSRCISLFQDTLYKEKREFPSWKECLPWLARLRGLERCRTEGKFASPRIAVRAQAWVSGLVSRCGSNERQLIDVSLAPLAFSPSLPLSLNKSTKSSLFAKNEARMPMQTTSRWKIQSTDVSTPTSIILHRKTHDAISSLVCINRKISIRNEGFNTILDRLAYRNL